jgi:radical SAM protein with 4Fe4S-binding SPASM domain
VDDEKTRRRFPLPRKLMTWLYRKSRYSCPYPWDALFLLSDGTMSVCRFDFDARVKIGRFNESSLLELWNSDSMNSLRRAHMNFDFSDWSTCQNCDATWTANRHEYYRKTQKLKRRNGYKEDRNAWLTADPVQSKKEDGSGSFGGRKGY